MRQLISDENNVFLGQYSFAAQDPDAFTLSIDTRPLGLNDPEMANETSYYLSWWNEVVINAWDNSDASQIPIESFFYKITGNSDEDNESYQISSAQMTNYKNLTGIQLPVIGIDMSDKETPFKALN